MSQFEARDSALPTVPESMSAIVTSIASTEAEQPSSFEWVVSTIASDFVRLTSDQIEDGIQRALGTIGRYCDADHSVLCRFSAEGESAEGTFEWLAPGAESLCALISEHPLKQFSHLGKQLGTHQVLSYRTPTALPQHAKAERELWQSCGLHSGVFLPLVSGDTLVGFLAVTHKRERMDFTGDMLSVLRVTSQIFANAIDRQRAEQAERGEQERLRSVVDSDMIGVFFWDAAGKIVSANRAWLDLLGFSEADVGSARLTLKNTTPAEYHAGDQKYFEQVTENGQAPNREKELLRADGSRVPVVMGGARLSDDGAGVGFVLDFSERKAKERALRQSEERFRTLAQNVPGAVYMCRNDARFTMLYLNRAVEELTGYPPEAFIKNEISFQELYHPEDAGFIREEVNAALANRRPFHLQYRLKRAKDQWRWVEEHGQGVFSEEGQLLYLEGAVFDITDRKVAEEALRAAHHGLEKSVDERTEELRAANELLLSEVGVRRKMEAALHNEKQFLKKTLDQHEADRRLTAYEIHDGLAQYVAGALMHFEAASRDGDEDGSGTDEQFEHGLQLLRRTIDEARRLISGLRPPILDEQGIVAAIEYLINEHTEISGTINLEIVEPFARLSPLLESTLFRIVQEALNNIERHAGPDAKTMISLHKDDGCIHLEIRDWGAGFDNTAVSNKAHGLRGIRERARLMGGNAAIHSKRGVGTLVVVEIPEQEDVALRIPLRGPDAANNTKTG
ncbi:MAG: PAS domain S-box protein [Pirellulales bacterium]|nr:PAS domain S-box protein [Pirellulales bacterium]